MAIKFCSIAILYIVVSNIKWGMTCIWYVRSAIWDILSTSSAWRFHQTVCAPFEPYVRGTNSRRSAITNGKRLTLLKKNDGEVILVRFNFNLVQFVGLKIKIDTTTLVSSGFALFDRYCIPFHSERDRWCSKFNFNGETHSPNVAGGMHEPYQIYEN